MNRAGLTADVDFQRQLDPGAGQITKDALATVERYPIPALLTAAVLGFILSRSLPRIHRGSPL